MSETANDKPADVDGSAASLGSHSSCPDVCSQCRWLSCTNPVCDYVRDGLVLDNKFFV